jgi:hypothetical protein
MASDSRNFSRTDIICTFDIPPNIVFVDPNILIVQKIAFCACCIPQQNFTTAPSTPGEVSNAHPFKHLSHLRTTTRPLPINPWISCFACDVMPSFTANPPPRQKAAAASPPGPDDDDHIEFARLATSSTQKEKGSY